jgi:hypothetical protein
MRPARKWPPACALAFILVTCGGFWIGAGLILSACVS